MSIELKGITKNFGSIRALNSVNLNFEKGKIYGLLGRNGAGKSTMLSIISNRMFADEGSVFIDGVNSIENDQAQSKLYLMSEKTYYPETMRVRDALKYTKIFYTKFDIDAALDLCQNFELNTATKIKGLSTGYLSIFKLVIALNTNAPYVLLDEPVLGLDANHRELFYKTILKKYSDSPSCYVLSTHLIEEVSGIIEDVIILKQGQIIKNETRDFLLSNGYTITGPTSLVDTYIKGKEVIGQDNLGGLKTAYLLGTPKNHELTSGLELSKMDLQKLFIQLTNA